MADVQPAASAQRDDMGDVRGTVQRVRDGGRRLVERDTRAFDASLVGYRDRDPQRPEIHLHRR